MSTEPDSEPATEPASEDATPAELVTRGTDLGARIGGLQQAITAARGRLDVGLLDDVAEVADRAAGRLRLSAQHTVIAIAGATGSGKSTTFNALTGLELSSTGVRRPTTSWATACVWGREGAEEVLDWLGIPPRHQTMRDSMLDSGLTGAATPDEALDGVVLMDLPDHDSTEVAHHLEVDRLVELADLLVWVLDPQKYADAAIHDRYLAPLAGHSDVMLVVLNHIDTVPADRRDAMVDDVRRLLDADGLPGVPILAVSAREGLGMADLRAEIARRVAEKKATRSKIEADLREAALRIDATAGPGKAHQLAQQRLRDLDDALAASAGVPTSVSAVERSLRSRLVRATSWPPLALLPASDPLKRLELDVGDAAAGLRGSDSAGSAPVAADVQRARIGVELGALADDASAGLGAPWIAAVRSAALGRTEEVAGRLEGAVGGPGQVDAVTVPGWARAVQALQWLLLLGVIGGVVWTVLAALGSGGVPVVVPVAVAIVCLVLGLVLAVVGRRAALATARDRAAALDRTWRRQVHGIGEELVLAPVHAELEAHAVVKRGLAPALR